jgi:threonine/homoserine/homoserine lactone efflux protein
VLIVVSVTLCLCAAAIAASAKVVRVAMDRLGLDSMTVLLWFGLAEWPSERPAPRRARAAKAVRDQPARRRSPHRSLARRAVRRRPAQPSV